ncbi:MAG: hypothetical protein ACSHXB_18805 [Sulfitobacter sp.]
MSDPVTNAEVEDVLSSIRRLVSEDKRPLHTQKAAPANDRLVLTPALRVADVPDEEIGFDNDHQNGDDEITDQDSAVSTAEQDEETLFDDPAHDYDADPYNFADDSDEDGESDAAIDLSGLELDVENQPEQDDHQGADVGSGDDKVEGVVERAKAASLSAKIEALETAIGNISDTWEPDAPGEDDYSGTEAPAMAWEDDVDRDAMGALLTDGDDHDKDMERAAETRGEPKVEAAPESEEPTAHDTSDADSFAFASEDQLIDEEALRDLVSDIVRSELQGALGERITRNVRKLVRREIHRALTAQELE